MKTSKLLFALLLTTLIGFYSCTTERKDVVDPKVGTWKETSSNGTIELTYTTDKKIIIKLTPTNGNVSIANASWNKNLSENVDVYETTAIADGGVNVQVTEPYFRLKMTISGSSANVIVYEAQNTISGATSNTKIAHQATMIKQ